MTTQRIAPQDAQTASQVRTTSFFGEQMSTKKVMLVNENFENTTLDTRRWAKQEGSGGTVTIASGVCTINSGTNSAGYAHLDTYHRMCPFLGGALLLRALMRFSTDEDADNVREIGFRDDAETTKVFFKSAEGLTFNIEDAGAAAITPLDVIGHVTPDANEFFLVEILQGCQVSELWLNGNRVCSVPLAGETGILTQKHVFRAFARSHNSGSTTANQLEIAEWSVLHIGEMAEGPARNVVFTSAGADAQIVYGSGVLERVVQIAAGGETWNIRDGVAAGGIDLLDYRVVAASKDQIPLGLYFADGLYFDHIGGVGTDVLALHVRGV